MERKSLPQRIVGGVKSLARHLIDLDYNRRFESMTGSYRGVFGSFAAALASAPRKKVGYDHAEMAHIYDERIGTAFPSDYPAMFWLARLLDSISSVYDLGGHVGVSYYSYAKYLDFAPSLRWRVCDMPQIIAVGAEMAREHGAASLDFTSDIADADGFDLLLVNGALQYIETPLADSLRAMQRPPHHLLVNKLPVYEGETFITLENTLHSFNAYCIRNRAQFVASLESLGYKLVDEWQTPDITCHIPLHRDRSIHAYTGFYFHRA